MFNTMIMYVKSSSQKCKKTQQRPNEINQSRDAKNRVTNGDFSRKKRKKQKDVFDTHIN